MTDELDEYGFPRFEQNEFPVAYLITFRTYGTWLHGDQRSSVRRNGNSRYGGPKVMPSVPLKESMAATQKDNSFILNIDQRRCVEAAINQVCEYRKYLLERSTCEPIMVTRSYQPL